MSSTSEELASQAESLNEVIMFFNTGKNAQKEFHSSIAVEFHKSADKRTTAANKRGGKIINIEDPNKNFETY